MCDEWETRQRSWSRTREVMDRMYDEMNKFAGTIEFTIVEAVKS